MVIGPLDPNQADYGFLTDLFTLMQPRYLELNLDSIEAEIDPLRSRFHVVAKFKGCGEWELMPSLTGRVDDALESLEEIKIWFPDFKTFNLDE